MKFNRTLIIALLTSLSLFSSCKDESLNPVKDPDGGVNGLARFVLSDGKFMPATAVPGPSDLAGFGTSQSTIDKSVFFDPANLAGSKVKVNLRWLSFDKRVEVSKMKVYVSFLEEYIDSQGNPAVADHGNGTGKSIAALEFTGKKHNEPVEFELTPAMIYDMYKDAKFSYDKKDASGKPLEIAVFNNPDNPRPDGNRFISGDRFRITWELTTADGTVYKWWSFNIASSTAYANTFLDWGVK